MKTQIGQGEQMKQRSGGKATALCLLFWWAALSVPSAAFWFIALAGAGEETAPIYLLMGIVWGGVAFWAWPTMRKYSRCADDAPCDTPATGCWACRKSDKKAQADRAEYERYQALQEKFSKDK